MFWTFRMFLLATNIWPLKEMKLKFSILPCDVRHNVLRQTTNLNLDQRGFEHLNQSTKSFSRSVANKEASGCGKGRECFPSVSAAGACHMAAGRNLSPCVSGDIWTRSHNHQLTAVAPFTWGLEGHAFGGIKRGQGCN